MKTNKYHKMVVCHPTRGAWGGVGRGARDRQEEGHGLVTEPALHTLPSHTPHRLTTMQRDTQGGHRSRSRPLYASSNIFVVDTACRCTVAHH